MENQGTEKETAQEKQFCLKCGKDITAGRECGCDGNCSCNGNCGCHH